MTRHIRKSVAVGVLGAMFWAGSAMPAQAQFWPRGNPGIYYNTPYGNYGLSYSTRSSFSYSWVNPFTRQPYSVAYNYSYSGPPPGYFGPRYVPTYSAPPMYYQPNYYSGGSMANPVVREQLRFFAGGPQAPAPAPVAPRKPKAEAVVVQPKPGAANAAKPVAVDPKLVAAADDDIFSGQALNALATAIRNLEAKGAKADAPLLPAELLTKVHFVGAPGADAIAILRDGVPAFPALFDRQQFLFMKTGYEKPLTAVAEAMLKGKAVPAADVTDLAAANKKAREAFEPMMKDVAAKDATEVKAFVDAVDLLVLTAKDASLDGVIVAKWSTVGASVADVVHHLAKYKLTFGPSNGQDDVYRALYRGLVTYYTSLAANGVR